MRVNRSSLRVCRQFADFIEHEALPGTGVDPGTFWGRAFRSRSMNLVHATGACWTSEPTCRPKSTDGTSKIAAFLTIQVDTRRFLRKSAICCRRAILFPSAPRTSIRKLPKSRVRNWVVPITIARFALNARKRPLEFTLRCAVRHRCPGRAADRLLVRSGKGGRGRELVQRLFSTRSSSWSLAPTPPRQDIPSPMAALSCRSKEAKPDFAGLTSSRDTRARRNVRIPFSFATTLCTSNWCSTRDIRLDLGTRRGWRTWCWNRRSPRSWTAKTPSPSLIPRTKIAAYRNWLGVMKGDLSAKVSKGGQEFDRRLNPDRSYLDHRGHPLTLKGRALLLVRNVGHLMTTEITLDRDGREIGEGLLDAMCTVMIALHDLRGLGNEFVLRVGLRSSSQRCTDQRRLPLQTRCSSTWSRCLAFRNLRSRWA